MNMFPKRSRLKIRNIGAVYSPFSPLLILQGPCRSTGEVEDVFEGHAVKLITEFFIQGFFHGLA